MVGFWYIRSIFIGGLLLKTNRSTEEASLWAFCCIVLRP
uniref:Uncharacterized protein n=1 Tax=Anguilla anguilla TaxID=7936 RepID=A0A0E9RG52_ANGAN